MGVGAFVSQTVSVVGGRDRGLYMFTGGVGCWEGKGEMRT